MTVRVVVVGDVLLDRDIEGDVRRVCPDAPVPVVDVDRTTERAGGAGLVATLLDRPGVSPHLVTAIADDEPGERLLGLLDRRLQVSPILSASATRCKTRVRSAGQSLLRIDAAPTAEVGDDCDLAALEAALNDADVVLVSDYAGGVVSHPEVRAALERCALRRPMIWDPHPRGSEPVPGVTVVTPNRSEAVQFGTSQEPDQLAVELRDRWRAWSLAVTDGCHGVYVAAGDGPLFTPAPFQYQGDSCGAGDRFAGTVAVEIGSGATVSTAVEAAVKDTAAWLALGGVTPAPEPEADREPGPLEAFAVAEKIRAAGGSVVATGGCFDILHAGHIASLEAASRLGDALIVLVNSDESVRRLKGSGRPVNSEADRCQVLRSLRFVDAVVVFDGDDPIAALRELRPDVWAKGGDYTADMLPEAPIIAGWGGRVVLVPFLPGRSTTAILEGGRIS
ncbi:PfkB family carbohydrate kinase [Kribbella sp. CA-293567]|uniref:PfkB family carbohydrate kinase n=1 Tax=Kribbella sp. CA-293567 TaxID=3002436 RepID=UPI0022DDEA06|nr:PfkB family carbohydrate kinase [Kribbella sp. CA-293567]WBQ08310.1 PfkB family carbohydrate kinase [Kribbella sp. CA-293567]